MISLIVSIIVVSIIAVLLIPVTISINSVRSGGKIEGTFSISWVIFLLRYTLRERRSELFVFGKGIFRHKAFEVKPPEMEPIKERKKSRKMPHDRDFLNMTGPMLRLFKDLVHAFRIKYFHIDITFGLSDPANTGILTGFMHAVRSSLKKEKDFKFTPDFTKQVMGWSLRSKASITPIKIVIPLVKFAANRKVLRFALQII